MKRILLIFLTISLCLLAFSGCAEECEHSWQRTANFDQHTAVDKCSICEETRMYTDRESLPSQASSFPNQPPFLYVHDGKAQIKAWRGTHSWYVENEDGTGSGICADSSHPLECKDSVPAIKVAQKATLTLNLEGNPSKITVKRYNLNTKNYDNYEEIIVSGNQIEVKSGDYLYEVIASWSSQAYNGTVYYAFRTEKRGNSLSADEIPELLEFRIAENVDGFDFSSYQPKYGIMGGREYYGTGYVPTLDEDGQQIDPEHCVIYTVTNYPDYSSNSLCITRITVTDPAVTVYGLSLSSTSDEIRSKMTAEGFTVTEAGTALKAEKDNLRFTFSKDAITVSAEVTNRLGIVF